MQNNEAKYRLWDYWIYEDYTYVVTEEKIENNITLRLMWKKNNDSDKKI